jgi:hypothetical protein
MMQALVVLFVSISLSQGAPAATTGRIVTVPITVSTAGTSGGTIGGTFTTFSSGTSDGRTQPPPEVVVTDADIGGLRVVVRRPPR